MKLVFNSPNGSSLQDWWVWPFWTQFLYVSEITDDGRKISITNISSFFLGRATHNLTTTVAILQLVGISIHECMLCSSGKLGSCGGSSAGGAQVLAGSDQQG